MKKRTAIADRFWNKVGAPNENGCWPWLAGSDHAGYGRILGDDGRAKRAHRVSYEITRGPIPNGLVIDHLCRNHSCVNPDHLEAVTQRENTMRGIGLTAIHSAKTHCPSGHPYDSVNTYVLPDGHRLCRTCGRAHRAAYRQRIKARSELGGTHAA